MLNQKSLFQTEEQQSLTLYKEPLDLFFPSKVGYIEILNLKKIDSTSSRSIENNFSVSYFGKDHFKERSWLLSEDQYISVNSFEYEPIIKKDVNHSYTGFRKTENMKQVRSIAIDIDQYTLNLTKDDALVYLEQMIHEGLIPRPNMIQASNGIQIFYGIGGGAAPSLWSWVSSITKEFIHALEPIGADFKACLPTHLVRLPNSINLVRNKKNEVIRKEIVQATIMNENPYSLQQLEVYRKKLEARRNFNDNSSSLKKEAVSTVHHFSQASKYFNNINRGRIRFLRELAVYRKENMIGHRHLYVYTYAYHLSLLFGCQDRVSKAVYRSTDNFSCEGFSKEEIDRTIEDAFNGAIEFLQIFTQNGFKIHFELNDGIIKPMKTQTIYDKLKVTTDEVNHIQRKKKRLQKRKEVGTVRSQDSISRSVQDRRLAIIKLKEENDSHWTRKRLSEHLGVSIDTIKKDLSEIRKSSQTNSD